MSASQCLASPQPVLAALVLLLRACEGGGEAAGEHHAEHGDHGQDAAHSREDHQDDGDLSVQPLFYDKQTTCHNKKDGYYKTCNPNYIRNLDFRNHRILSAKIIFLIKKMK